MTTITHKTLQRYLDALVDDSVRWTRIGYESRSWGYSDSHLFVALDDLVARQNASKLADRKPFTNPWS